MPVKAASMMQACEGCKAQNVKCDLGLPSGIPPCIRCRRELTVCSFSFSDKRKTQTPPGKPQPVSPPAQLTQADLNNIVIDYLAKRGYNRTVATLQAESTEPVIPKYEDTWDMTRDTARIFAAEQASSRRNLNDIVFKYLAKKGYARTEAVLRCEVELQEIDQMMEGMKNDAKGQEPWVIAANPLVKWAKKETKEDSEDEDWEML
ncbi:uncharacterized protein AB675_9506 [Cyphellophora attinorum]|uniref:Zn(2)-C6 fungal-type domain-containing protein n=1 Tax=Cyphellophora attinorum TaxID=1664694 RepID=A0A0N0NP77_9EURO|nr:uncharacterized protein AB675_9506 [Phialophora attinorum]KPI42219.1 hypothetical protein AB675_9506 [Phialophora attinorum]